LLKAIKYNCGTASFPSARKDSTKMKKDCGLKPDSLFFIFISGLKAGASQARVMHCPGLQAGVNREIFS
jgi:hypothetical protein